MAQDDSKGRLSRRDFLRMTLTGAGGVVLAACGAAPPAAAPSAAPMADATAPAAVAGGKMTVLQRQEYFPGVETRFRDLVTQFVTGQGMELDISTVNPESFGDFVAKMQAAVQAGNPPDLVYQTNTSPQQLYFLDTLEDVTDVVDELVSMYGAIVPNTAEQNGKIDGRWWSVPFFSHTGAWFARKDAFEAAGVDVLSLDTLDKRREAALAASDASKELWGWGLTVNKSGDGHGTIMSIIHSFGGAVVDASGEKVVLNSPETVAAVKWIAETYTGEKYKPMLPPGIESWTDTSNNEAYLAGKIALTQNAFSVYAAARRDANPVFPNTAILPFPSAADGTVLNAPGSGWFHIFKGAKNVAMAKETILHMLKPENFTPLVSEGGGLVLPAYKNIWTDAINALDPNFATLQTIIFSDSKYTGFAYPARPNPATTAAEASAFHSEMVANVTSGRMTAEEAVKDAHDKVVRIFEELGLPQG